MSDHVKWSEIKRKRTARRSTWFTPSDLVDVANDGRLTDWLGWYEDELARRDERLRDAERRYEQLRRFTVGQVRALQEVARREHRLRAFARFVVQLDDVDDSVNVAERRVITLQRLIECAQRALDADDSEENET